MLCVKDTEPNKAAGSMILETLMPPVNDATPEPEAKPWPSKVLNGLLPVGSRTDVFSVMVGMSRVKGKG